MLLLLLLLSWVSSLSAFKIGRRYVYNYETQIVSGISGASALYAGLKVKAIVTLQFTGETTAELQLGDVLLMKVNDEIQGADPSTEMLADDFFLIMTGRDMDTIHDKLVLPTQFTYAEGHISDFQTNEKDPIWSVNIKRGIISLFEMNIDSKRSLQDDFSYEIFNTPAQQEFGFIKTVEPTPAGECETFYKIQPDPPRGTENEFFVTKIRDYKNCLDRPLFTRSMTSSWYCSECEDEKPQPIESTSTTEYSLIGDSSMFVIVSAVAAEQHDLTPYSEKGGRITTFIRQALTMKDVDTIPNQRRTVSTSYTQPSGLKMDIPQSADNPSNPFFPNSLMQKVEVEKQQQDSCVIEQVGEIMDILMSEEKEENHESPDLVLRMISVLRKASGVAIERLVKKYTGSAVARKLLFEILPVVGTRDSTIEVTKALAEDLVPMEVTPRCLYMLAMAAKPEPILIKQIMILLERHKMSVNRSITRAAWLSIGIIGQNLCKWHQSTVERTKKKIATIKHLLVDAGPRYIRQELMRMLQMEQDLLDQTSNLYKRMKHGIVEALVNLLENTNSEMQILGLKTLGNTGFEEILQYMIPFCEKTKPREMRIEALQSLRLVGWKFPNEVAKYLLPIYLDTREPSDIRMYAVQSIFLSNPQQKVLNILAQSLWKERNMQVGSFVYSYLEQMSRMTSPCQLSLVRRIVTALQIAKKWSPGLSNSQFRYFSAFSDSFQMGTFIEMSMMKNTPSQVPSAAAFKLRSNIFGYNTDVLEVGIYGEKLSSKMDTPLLTILKELLKSPHSHNSTDFSKVAKDTKEIMKNVYFRMFGHELNYITIENDIIQDLLKGLIQVSKNNYIKSRQDVSRTDVFALTLVDHYLPTTVGIPINIKLDAAARLILKFQTNRTLSDIPDVNIPTLNVDIQPVFSSAIRGSVHVLAPFMNAGVDINAALMADTAVSVSATIDIIKRKLFTEVAFQKEPVFHIDVTPSTFVCESRCRRPMIYKKEFTFVNGVEKVPISLTIGKHFGGLSIDVSGQYTARKDLPYVPYVPLCGKQELSITMKFVSGKMERAFFEAQLVDMFTSKMDEEKMYSESNGIASSPKGYYNLRNFDVSMNDITVSFNKTLKELSPSPTFGLVLSTKIEDQQTQLNSQLIVLLMQDQTPFQHYLKAVLKTTTSPSINELGPFEVSFDAKLQLPNISKSVQEIIQPKNQIPVLDEIENRLLVESMEQFVTILSSHYVRQFTHLASFDDTSLRGEEVLNELLRIPLPNKDVLVGMLHHQISAENMFKQLKPLTISQLTTKNGLANFRKLGNMCRDVINQIGQHGSMGDPYSAPVLQYIVGNQLSLHAKLLNIIHNIGKMGKRVFFSSVLIKNKLKSQQVYLLKFIKRFMKSLPARQAVEEKDIISTLSSGDAEMFRYAHKIEKDQSKVMLHFLSKQCTVGGTSFRQLLTAISSVQDKLLSTLESGKMPDGRLVFKVSSIIINQAKLTYAFIPSVLQSDQISVEERESILSIASLVLIRGKIMVKTLPIVSDLNQESSVIVPMLPKEQVPLYNALLQTEQQAVFLTLKSILMLQHSDTLNLTKFSEHVKHYLMSVQKLSSLTFSATSNIISKGVLPNSAVLLKLIKITTWHEHVFKLCKTAVSQNTVLSTSEIFKIVNENDYGNILLGNIITMISEMKPLLLKLRRNYLMEIRREPCISYSETNDIQSWQMRTKTAIKSLAGQDYPVEEFENVISKFIKECTLASERIDSVDASSLNSTNINIRAIRKDQLAIINSLLTVVSDMDMPQNSLPLIQHLYGLKLQLQNNVSDKSCGVVDSSSVGSGQVAEEVIPNLVLDATLKFGYSKSLKEKISVKGFGKKSVQQLIWEYDQATVFNRDPTVVDDIAGDNELSLSGSRQEKLASNMKGIKRMEVIVDYEQVKSVASIREWTSRIRDLMISSWYQDFEGSVNDISLPKLMYVKINLEPDDKEVDISFQTDEEFTAFRRIKTPGLIQELLSYGSDYWQRDDMSASTPQDDCSLRNKTRTMNKVIRGLKVICFSKETVSFCPEHCLPSETISKTMAFQCGEASNAKTQDLLKTNLLTTVDISQLTTTLFTKKILVPTTCHGL